MEQNLIKPEAVILAFDGSVIACLVKEYKDQILNGRIVKIAQPEKNELLLTIKKDGQQKKLLISAEAALPITYLTEENKTSPLTAPAFCMLLRKHILNGQIIGIYQPSMERIIDFHIEHYNEMGDLCQKILTVELMGKHSNIIFRDGDHILDSIKHISSLVSSVREVLPGRDYFIPFADEKKDPFQTSEEDFSMVFVSGNPLSKTLCSVFTGISTQLAEEILNLCGIDSDRPAGSLSQKEIHTMYGSFKGLMEMINRGDFSPQIYYENQVPFAYAALDLKIYQNLEKESYDSISRLLYAYYAKKKTYTELRQKTASLRQTIQTLLNKDYKKYDLQLKQLDDTKKKEIYQLYGELITAYGYSVPEGSVSMEAEDYHTGKMVTIPLDPTIPVIANGKRYFDKYAKLKRTYEALTKIIRQTKEEIDHLESILTSLDMVQEEADISDLRREMVESGYSKQTGSQKKQAKKESKSTPLHYISSDGFDIYVGKNNIQNEYLTLKFADGNDYWFHAKKLPGSHVILKTNGSEIPDRTFEEAAQLAAHYSKAEGASKVEVDYVQRKQLKKPAGSKPGYVIYHTNYSMSASTDISGIKEI